MGRDRTVERVERDWRSLLATIDAVPEGALLDAGAVGEWSVRDLLTHIATWEREFLKALTVILAGERLPHYSTLYGGIDAFNAREQAAARGLSTAQARRALVETHAELLRTLRGLPLQAPRAEERLRRRLRQDTSHHYAEHARQVEAWWQQVR